MSLGSIRTTILRYAFRHDHKAAVVAAVLTGRQRNELIAVFGGHAGIVKGQFLALSNEADKIIGALCVYKAIKLECFGTVGEVFIPLPLVFNLGAFGYAPERRVQWLILKREML